MPELKPCPNPWCASHSHPERNYVPYIKKSHQVSDCTVACSVCPMVGPWRWTEEEAVAAWNDRTPVGATESA